MHYTYKCVCSNNSQSKTTTLLDERKEFWRGNGNALSSHAEMIHKATCTHTEHTHAS